MIVVDASVWASFVLTDDAHHQTSETWIVTQIAKHQTFAVPALFAVEVGGAVRRRSGRTDDATWAVSRIHRDPYFHVVDLEERFSATAAAVAIQLALKGADALYVVLALRFSVPLVTWDNEQRERAGQIIDVMTPAQALERLA